MLQNKFCGLTSRTRMVVMKLVAKGHEEKSMKEVEKGNDKQQDKCSICFKEFESVLLLNEHYIVCKKTLQCKQCKE